METTEEDERATLAYLDDADARHDLEVEIEQLQAALISARRIGVAVGITMAAAELTEAEAFRLLDRVSQRQNRKLRHIADEIVATGEVPQA